MLVCLHEKCKFYAAYLFWHLKVCNFLKERESKIINFQPWNITNSKLNPTALHWRKETRISQGLEDELFSVVPVSNHLATALHHDREVLAGKHQSNSLNKTDKEMIRNVYILYKPVCERREMSCSGRTILTEFKHVSVSVNEEASVWILYWETSVWAWQRSTRCPSANTHTLTQPSISHLLVSLWCIQIHTSVSSIKTNEPALWHDESKTSRK